MKLHQKLSLSYYRSFKLPVTILRPFNTYGPRQSERAIIPRINCRGVSIRATGGRSARAHHQNILEPIFIYGTNIKSI